MFKKVLVAALVGYVAYEVSKDQKGMEEVLNGGTPDSNFIQKPDVIVIEDDPKAEVKKAAPAKKSTSTAKKAPAKKTTTAKKTTATKSTAAKKTTSTAKKAPAKKTTSTAKKTTSTAKKAPAKKAAPKKK